MASVIGESGAWRGIAANLRSCGLEVQKVNDIEPLWTGFRSTCQTSVERKKSEIAQGVKSKETQIANFRSEKGFLRSFLNWFRILGCRIVISRLNLEERRHIDALSKKINRLKKILASTEMTGARAELDVIAHLTNLPMEYTVFNDVRLIADRFIYFNGAVLQSAQIDHLVLCPAGVFVIETKRWSKHFVESGQYHDPFDQIQRSAYLCYDRLRSKFGKIRVRSVIACAGKLPSRPQESQVKVLSVAELVGYISWFRQPELTSDRMLQVHHYMQGFVEI